MRFVDRVLFALLVNFSLESLFSFFQLYSVALLILGILVKYCRYLVDHKRSLTSTSNRFAISFKVFKSGWIVF